MEHEMNKLTIVVIVQNDDKEPDKCIESIIACNDVTDAMIVVYNNSNNEVFHKWASDQESFIYAYPEKGICSYSSAINEILTELDIHSDVMLVNAHHMAYPGLISKMHYALYQNDTYGVVAASFNGADYYGLGYETFATDYIGLVEKSLAKDTTESWRSHYIEPEGSIIIRDSLAEILKKKRDIGNRKEFFKYIEELTKKNNFTIQVLESGYWWNLQDKTIEKMVEIKKEGIKLTIAIPTYNRANRALDVANYIITNRKKYDCEESVEILVSDNCSTIHQEELEQLKILSENEKNFSFYQSDSNRGYKGNIRKVIEKSKGKYCLIQSDEDTTLFPAVLLYLRYLELHPDISCMKGRTSYQYNSWMPSYGKKGLDAINLFYLIGNYVSGIIYNRDIINNSFIENLYNTFDNKNNIGFDYYPHLFIDAYALCNGSFASSNIMLINEGEEEDTGSIVGNEMFSYERPESRIAQGMGYVKELDFLEINDENKMHLYVKIFQKTKYLLNMSKRKYLAKGYVWDDIVKDAIAMFRKEFEDLQMKEKNIYKTLILDYLSTEETNKLS